MKVYVPILKGRILQIFHLIFIYLRYLYLLRATFRGGYASYRKNVADIIIL